jgi:hypothetical protein
LLSPALRDGRVAQALVGNHLIGMNTLRSFPAVAVLMKGTNAVGFLLS